MKATITPHAAAGRRRDMRKALAQYLAAVAAFRAAMDARRAADRAVAAFPALDFPVAVALAALAGAASPARAANRAWRDRPAVPSLNALARAEHAAEHAADAVFRAREWYQQARRYVRAIDRGDIEVVKGAAWSERGLRNVQNANSRR